MSDIDGYVLEVGAKWLLLARTRDGGFSDGFIAIRRRDLVDLTLDRSFEATIAQRLPGWPPTHPLLPGSLNTTKGLLQAVHDLDRLMGIQIAWRRPAIWIGRLYSRSERHVRLATVNPIGEWDDDGFKRFRLRELVAIEWDSEYLRGLTMVAGTLPPPDMSYEIR